MKRIFFLLVLSLVSRSMYAQNTFPSTGNVGIGTTSPTVGLQLGVTDGNILSKQIQIPGTYNFERLSMGHYGNGNMAIEMVNHSNYVSSYGVRLTANIDDGVAGLQFQYAPYQSSYGALSYQTAMFMGINGNVGIGTVYPNEKLSVKGKIRAQEIKVELTGWADFVFARDYKLPSLSETETHIKEKGHLPGIPSAAEVKENGIELGEMNKKLLQKIEELTLHLIEMQKEVKSQRMEIDSLKQK